MDAFYKPAICLQFTILVSRIIIILFKTTRQRPRSISSISIKQCFIELEINLQRVFHAIVTFSSQQPTYGKDPLHYPLSL